MDDLHAAGPIYARCIRLRALWGVSPVVVRVHSSAWRTALRSYPTAHLSRDGMRCGATDTRSWSGAQARP
jgi:hypothetical protein